MIIHSPFTQSFAQVSLVEMSSYTTGSGKNEKRVAQFTVKAKAWDETLGGFQFDLRLAELLADRFNDKWGKSSKGKGKDVRAFHKAMAKIRAQVSEFPYNCVMWYVAGWLSMCARSVTRPY
jgi:molecular chaperone DnaK (HSP70)